MNDVNFIEAIIEYLVDYYFESKKVIDFIEIFDVSSKANFIEITKLGVEEECLLKRNWFKEIVVKAWIRSNFEWSKFSIELEKIMKEADLLYRK